jgi:hypothetical protein
MNAIATEIEVRAVKAESEASQEQEHEVKALVELSDAQLALVGGGFGNYIWL